MNKTYSSPIFSTGKREEMESNSKNVLMLTMPQLVGVKCIKL